MWTNISFTFLCLLLTSHVVNSHAKGKFSQDSDCGKTKGCYSDCAKGCTYEVAWKDTGTSVTFDITFDLGTNTAWWAAIGLSQDAKMGGDQVVACHNENGGVRAYRTQNVGKSNQPETQTGLQQTQGSVTNSLLTCSFVLQKADVSLETDSYLFFANGALNGNAKRMHSKLPQISPSVVDFQSVQIIGGTAIQVMIKVHGLLMIAAWIMCASIGVVLARYYKPVWADRKLLGEKVWFQIHRLLMILTLLFVVAAFVVIFVHVEGWSQISEDEDYKKAHPYLGVVVTALTIMNPLMAFFRPHPEDKNRVIFNWAHWLVGTSARILAVITVFIGVTLSKSGAPDYVIYILGAYAAYQLFIELVLEFHECCVVRANKGKGSAYELKGIADPDSKPAPVVPKGEKFKQVVLGLHAVVIVGLTATIMIIVGIN